MSTQQELNAAISGTLLVLKGASQIVVKIIEVNERPSDDLMARLALVAAGLEYAKDTLQMLLSPAPAAVPPNETGPQDSLLTANLEQAGDTPEQAVWNYMVRLARDARFGVLGQNLED